MQIIQETRTIIKAEDGKVLRKKRDGRVVGDTVHLGYDYYEAGILLKKPHLAKPDDYEEVDLVKITDADGNVTQEFPKDNEFKRLNRILQIFNEEKIAIQNYDLTDSEKLQLKQLYPELEKDFLVGQELKQGTIFQYKNGLYEVLQDHVLQPYYYPNENTQDIYKEIIETSMNHESLI